MPVEDQKKSVESNNNAETLEQKVERLEKENKELKERVAKYESQADQGALKEEVMVDRLYRFGKSSLDKKEVQQILSGLASEYKSKITDFINNNKIEDLQKYLNELVDKGVIDKSKLQAACETKGIWLYKNGHIMEDGKFGPQTVEAIRMLKGEGKKEDNKEENKEEGKNEGEGKKEDNKEENKEEGEKKEGEKKTVDGMVKALNLTEANANNLDRTKYGIPNNVKVYERSGKAGYYYFDNTSVIFIPNLEHDNNAYCCIQKLNLSSGIKNGKETWTKHYPSNAPIFKDYVQRCLGLGRTAEYKNNKYQIKYINKSRNISDIFTKKRAVTNEYNPKKNLKLIDKKISILTFAKDLLKSDDLHWDSVKKTFYINGTSEGRSTLLENAAKIVTPITTIANLGKNAETLKTLNNTISSVKSELGGRIDAFVSDLFTAAKKG